MQRARPFPSRFREGDAVLVDGSVGYMDIWRVRARVEESEQPGQELCGEKRQSPTDFKRLTGMHSFHQPIPFGDETT